MKIFVLSLILTSTIALPYGRLEPHNSDFRGIKTHSTGTSEKLVGDDHYGSGYRRSGIGSVYDDEQRLDRDRTGHRQNIERTRSHYDGRSDTTGYGSHSNPYGSGYGNIRGSQQEPSDYQGGVKGRPTGGYRTHGY